MMGSDVHRMAQPNRMRSKAVGSARTGCTGIELRSGVWRLQNHRLGRGTGRGRGLHDRCKERRVESDTVVVKPL